MTSFMGPMAPPPAAPAQPQALDIRTDPNRRQQFKQFMKQRTSMAPMVSAPIAQPPMPMMQPPMPMGGQDIDIFNPVNLHEGGLVPSLNSLQQQAAQFSQQLQSTVMGGGSGGSMGGGGFGGSFNSGGGMGGGFSSPGFTTNTTSGGLVPGGLKSVSPPPDANVSDFFQNFNNTNSNDPNLQGGQQGGMQQAVVNPQVDPNPFISDQQSVMSSQQPMSSSVTNSPTTVYRDYGSQNIDNSNFRPAVSPYADQLRNNTRSELSSDSPFFNVPEAGTGQRLPSDSSALGGGVSNLIANNPYLSGIGGIGNFAGNLLMRNKGGAVPPRHTDIRGQDHMLSYITPDEADILKALGGSGEAGPMGIPSFYGDGGLGGDDVGDGSESDGMGDSQGEGSDTGEEAGGYEEVGAPAGYSDPADPDTGGFDIDVDSVDVAQDQQNMGFDVFDSIDDFNQQQEQQQQQQQAQRDRAIRDAFATTTSGKPIGTKSGYLSKASATEDQKAAGYKAMESVPGSRENLAAAAATNAVESVTGVPTDRLSSSKAGLLGLNPQDLLAIENFSYAPPAQTNVSLSRNPSSFTGKASAPSSFTDPLVASTPSSNVVSDFSPTPADQLADVYGIDLDALNAAVDDPNAPMGARGPAATDASAGIGYDPVTDMPYGLEFGTNPQTGAQISTNLAGLTEQQQKDQPLSMDIAQFIGSKPYGYEIDPQTNQVIGQVGTPPMGILGSLTSLAQNLFMGPPQTTQDLIERGAYTGMTGQGR